MAKQPSGERYEIEFSEDSRDFFCHYGFLMQLWQFIEKDVDDIMKVVLNCSDMHTNQIVCDVMHSFNAKLVIIDRALFIIFGEQSDIYKEWHEVRDWINKSKQYRDDAAHHSIMHDIDAITLVIGPPKLVPKHSIGKKKQNKSANEYKVDDLKSAIDFVKTYHFGTQHFISRLRPAFSSLRKSE